MYESLKWSERTSCATRGRSQRGMRKERRGGGGGTATLSWQSRLNSSAGKPGYTLKRALMPRPLSGCQVYAQRDPLKESTCSHFVSHLQYSASQQVSLA
ncbi:hypothetical protein EYF80_006195 [Liparis tanakae]|uniref:Uncharacterized protein n=1 Tax=Liparis tanakae TaxID=230148 RepID=A0A4Z2J0W5_9TELE|nr:hypothetical protein EYF80_006195 [Liparis tanakae]